MNKLLLALVALVTVTGMQNVSAGDLYKEVDVVVTDPISWPAQTTQDAIQSGAYPVKIGMLYSSRECAGGTCEVYAAEQADMVRFQGGSKVSAKKYKAIVLDDDNRLAPEGAAFVGSFKLEREPGHRMGLHRLK